MNSKILLLFLSLLLGTNNFSQEINFDISTEDYQLFPRDLNDLASVIFSGIISDETQLKQLKFERICFLLKNHKSPIHIFMYK